MTSASAHAESSFPRITLFALVAFAAITPLALLVAPALAAQLARELNASPSQIGTYFFVENGAFSAASLLSLIWLGRINVHHAALAALAVFIAGNLLTPLVLPDYTSLLLIRAMTGFGGGTLMVLSMISAQDAQNPDRIYGYWVAGQLVAGAVGLAALPHVFASFGLQSFYILLGLLTLALVPLYKGFLAPAAAPGSKKTGAAMDKPFLVLAAFTLAAVLIFYIAIGGAWTFASHAAAEAGIVEPQTGTLLAIASLFGIAGALITAVTGGRLYRRSMLLAGYAILVASLAGLAILKGAAGFAAAIFAFKFAWTFALPFIIAEVAQRDPSGRLVASTTMIIGTGLSLGPLFAGELLGAGWSLSAVFLAAAACGALSFACLAFSPRAASSLK
ncbi:MFS transporter [Pannonibacter sp. Q-1]